MKAKEAQEDANQRELELKKRLHDMELSSKAAEAENEREWKQKMVALEQTISATVNTAVEKRKLLRGGTSTTSNGDQNGALLYGTEYQNAGVSKNHDKDAACSVCAYGE